MARLSRSLTAVTHRASARSGRSPTAEVTFSKTRLGPSPSPSVGRFGASLWRHTPSNVTAVRLPRTVPPPARERGERGDSPTQSYREPRARPDHYGANLRWPPHS